MHSNMQQVWGEKVVNEEEEGKNKKEIVKNKTKQEIISIGKYLIVYFATSVSFVLERKSIRECVIYKKSNQVGNLLLNGK